MSGPKPESLNLKISGLYTTPNPFSEVPQGVSLAEATNMNLDKDSILNSRRGQGQYGVSPLGPIQPRAIFDFKDQLIVSFVDGTLSVDTNDNGSVWTPFAGTYLPPSGSGADRVPSFQSNKNLYILTQDGVQKLTSPTSEPRLAGVSKGLGGSGVTTGTSGFMATNTNVAYRVIWGYRDSNENLILGAPSDRIIVSNSSGGTRDVDLTFFIPADIDTSYFFQIYRSAGSATVNDEPDDELQLVDEISPTSAEILAGTVTYPDATPDNLRGVVIYTAPSLSTAGILGANTQPPFAVVGCTFAQMAFYGNTRTKHTLTNTLIATDAPDGIQVGDTLTFTAESTFTITGAAAENAVAGQFLVETGLTPAENIAITARSIVNVINTVASNVILAAYYTSGFEDLPGRMEFQRLTLSPTAFTITSNRASPWRPELPASGSTYANTSRNEAQPNNLYFSKVGQPEAVPILQFLPIGSPEEPILATVPLRDGVMVFKTDGLWRVTGNTPEQIQLTAINRDTRINAPFSPAELSNRVFLFTTQGVEAATDSDVSIVSRPIETDLLTLSSAQYPNFANVCFSIGYESDRKLIIGMPTTSSDSYATQSYIFNILTGQWTRWTKGMSAGIVKQSNDTLYTAGQAWGDSDYYIFKERKNFALTDYADEEYHMTVTSVNGLQIDVDDSSFLETGYTIQQGLNSAIITGIVTYDPPVESNTDRLWHVDSGEGFETLEEVEQIPYTLVPDAALLAGEYPLEIATDYFLYGPGSMSIRRGPVVDWYSTSQSNAWTLEFSTSWPVASETDVPSGLLWSFVNSDGEDLEVWFLGADEDPSRYAISFVTGGEGEIGGEFTVYDSSAWTAWAVVYDPDTGTMRIYQDGNQVYEGYVEPFVNFVDGWEWQPNIRGTAENVFDIEPFYMDEIRFTREALYKDASYDVATAPWTVETDPSGPAPATLTLDLLQDWDVDVDAVVYRPIYQAWTTNQFSAGNPGEMKHWADLSILYKETNFDDMQIGVTADTTNETRYVTMVPPKGTGGWGTFPWGTLPWGVTRAVKARLRTSIPKQAMRSNWIAVSGILNEAFTDTSLAGIAITYSQMSSRQKGSSRG